MYTPNFLPKAEVELLIRHLVTLLAFFFIPSSLAAAVLSMNVKEIDGTGSSIWRFIWTATISTNVALGGSGIPSFWREWRRRRPYRRSWKERVGDIL